MERLRADFCLLNGRVYPDTLAPNAPLEPTAINTSAKIAALRSLPVQVDASGELMAPAGRSDLQYQPLSALVTCNAGERVLLRFANLGFKESAMTLAGMKMKVVGKDATPMKGRDGTDTSYEASTVSFGAGESIDAIFTAPAFSGGSGSSGRAMTPTCCSIGPTSGPTTLPPPAWVACRTAVVRPKCAFIQPALGRRRHCRTPEPDMHES